MNTCLRCGFRARTYDEVVAHREPGACPLRARMYPHEGHHYRDGARVMPRHNRHENRVTCGRAVQRYGRVFVLGAAAASAIVLLGWVDRQDELGHVERAKLRTECVAAGGTPIETDSAGESVVYCKPMVTP